ncbi:MAG: BAPKO_0422 family outer member beta-barrel protein [Pseudobdellovibrionaceae bacterium]
MKSALIAAVLFFSLQANAKLAGGFFVGDPTSLTFKFWQNSEIAYDGGIAFAVSDYFLFYGDYLIHYPRMIAKTNKLFSKTEFYFGVGGVAAVTTKDRSRKDRVYGKKSGSFGMGVRVPIGIEWRPTEPPIGVYIEIAPGISIFPSTDAFAQGGVGIRYYF